MLQDFIQTTGVATRGWLLQRADEREEAEELGRGRLRGAGRKSCGEVGGAGAEVVFPLSFCLPMSSLALPFVF